MLHLEATLDIGFVSGGEERDSKRVAFWLQQRADGKVVAEELQRPAMRS
jgi:hypothetical protein